MLTRYETIMLYIMGGIDWLRRAFLKVFPLVGLLFSIVYAYKLILEKPHNFTIALIIASGLTVLYILWFALERKKAKK